jgi:hypothetical protein
MSRLPEGFAALEPFVDLWAIEGTAARAFLRGTAGEVERSAFFAAAQPLLGAALDRLDATPLAGFDAAEHRLMNLMLSAAHVSLADEIQASDEARHARMRERMVITRASADGPDA